MRVGLSLSGYETSYISRGSKPRHSARTHELQNFPSSRNSPTAAIVDIKSRVDESRLSDDEGLGTSLGAADEQDVTKLDSGVGPIAV